MGKGAWTIMCVIGAVVMAGVSIVSSVMGGCDSMVELASGNSTFMKCHWTFVADTYIGGLGVVVALMGATCKDQSGRRMAGLVLVATALAAACMPAWFAIGLCADASMHCHATAMAVWALCAVAAIIGIVQIAKSRPAAVAGPKRSV